MRLTQQQLEAHLWGAANILRGKTAGQDYKNYILSLMFYKRLCDQWENEADEAIADLERQQGRAFTEAQKAVFRARGEHRFSIPDGSRWGDVLAISEEIGKKLTDAMRAVANANDELRRVFTELPLKNTEVGKIPESWDVVKGKEAFVVFSGGNSSADALKRPQNHKSSDAWFMKVDDFNLPENRRSITRTKLGFQTADNPTFKVFLPQRSVFIMKEQVRRCHTH